MDVDRTERQFREAVENNAPFEMIYGQQQNNSPHNNGVLSLPFSWKECLDILDASIHSADGGGSRFHHRAKLETALALFNVPRPANTLFHTAEEVNRRCKTFRDALDAINLPKYHQLTGDLETIVSNLFHRARRGRIAKDKPLFDTYFTRLYDKGNTVDHYYY